MPLTQEQQRIGTRRTAMQQALLQGGATAPAPTPGVDPAWSRMFGASTPSLLLERRSQGADLAPSVMPEGPTTAVPGGAIGGPRSGAAGGPQPLGATPQTAGTMNSMAPGIFGNPDNGFSQRQQAGGLSNREMGGAPKPLRMGPPKAPLPPGAGPQGGLPGAAAGPLGAPVGAAGGKPPNPMADAIQKQMQAQPTPEASEQLAAPEMAAAQDVAPKAPMGIQFKREEAGATGKPWETDERSFEEKFGKAKPGNWSSWDAQRKADWQRENYRSAATGTGQQPSQGQATTQTTTDTTAAQPIEGTPWTADPRTFVEQFDKEKPPNWNSWDQARKNQWMREHYQASDDPVVNFTIWARQQGGFLTGLELGTLPPPDASNPRTFTIDDMASIADSVENPSQRMLLSKMHNLGQQLSSWQANPTGINVRDMEDARARYETLQGFLKDSYGFDFDPYGELEAARAGRIDEGTEGTTVPGNADALQPYARELLQIRNMLGKDAPQWMIEFAAGLAERDAANKRYDLANRTVGGAVDKFSGSPLATRSREEALRLLGSPDNTPWDVIQSQYVSDQDKMANQIVQNLSSSAARRGISAGGVQGIQGQLLGEQANQTARGLGDISVARAKAEQDALYRALGLAGDVSQLYDLGELNARIGQANFQRGAPQDQLSPLSGWGNSWLGQQAVNESGKAQGPGMGQSVAAGALSGAAAGATAGSVIPGLGTVIGGLVGAAIGAGGAYFSQK